MSTDGRRLALSPPLMPVQRLRQISSRSGQPNVEIDGVSYHSPYKPRREAQKFYASYPIEKADVILHFWMGFRVLRRGPSDRIKASARIIVFEPDEDLFKLSLGQLDNHAVLQDSRFQFAVGSRVCQFFDQGLLDQCQETGERLDCSAGGATEFNCLGN